ncbi:sulfotransferase 1C2-like [Haliotis rubra]|uniref:sulfotransferase 1C2-like n=1 Tax=Haliotis rubra TaxID=36100 RepID=UPI001EE5BCB4|nr:sulfotransferase 1C2-like [Haliotis rubra]
MSTPAERGMAAGWNVKLVMVDDVVEADLLTDNLKTMKSRSVRDDDIFLCTYPKADIDVHVISAIAAPQGTHWTWEILNMIVAGKAEYAKHWQNSTWLEYRTEEELDELASPRIFHTHLRPRQMPMLLWKRGCKVVYVERNIKDCAVSSYSQVSQQVWKEDPRREVTFIGSWDDYLTAYRDGCGSYVFILRIVAQN